MSDADSDSCTGNPFKGPSPLQLGDRIFGREREIDELLALLAANRLVLLHSISGCGKTSLVEAGLRPRLAEERLFGLPTIRMPRRDAVAGADHSLVASVMASITFSTPSAVPAVAGRPQSHYSRPLDAFLHNVRPRPATTDASRDFDLLIFDQFEEVLDESHVTEEDRRDFFRQVGLALKDRTRWALFVIREDYLGALEPYLTFLPTYLATRFRLKPLSLKDAKTAMIGLSKDTSVKFTADAAEHLSNELSGAQAQFGRPPTSVAFVEPVYLQVVCRYLWEDACRKKRPQLEVEHVRNHAPAEDHAKAADTPRRPPIDEALAQFYGTELSELPGIRPEPVSGGEPQTDIAAERVVREWFEEELIADCRIRRQVQQGPSLDLQQSEAILKRLENRYLVRRDDRLGPVWYELSHDRLIKPILASNQAWSVANLQPFQRAARTWRASGGHEGLHLAGRDLDIATRWAANNPARLLPYDCEFIAHSIDQQKSRLKARHSRIIRWGLGFSLIVACLTAIGMGAAMYNWKLKRESGQLALASTNSLTADPEQSLLIGLEAAYRLSGEFTPEVRAALNAALQSSRLLLRHDIQAVPYGAAFDRTLFEFVIADTAGKFRKIDAFTGRKTEIVDVAGDSQDRTGLSGMPFVFTGRFMAYATKYNGVHVIDMRTRDASPLRDISVNRPIFSIDIDAKQLLLAVGTGDGAFVSRIDDRTILRRFPGEMVGLAFTRTEDRPSSAVVAAVSGPIEIWDADSNTIPYRLETKGMAVSAVDISPEGDYVAFGTNDGQLIVWAPAQDIFGVLAQFPTRVTAVKYSRNGKMLAAGQNSGDVTLFRAPRDQIRRARSTVEVDTLARAGNQPRPQVATTIAVLRGHTRAVRSMDFSPDDLLLMTASEDKSARVWDASDAAVDSGLLAVAISGDSKVSARLAQAPNAMGEMVQTVTTTRSPEGRVCTLCNALALSGDGTRLAIAKTGGVTLIRTTSGEQLPLTKGMDEPSTYDVALTWDGKFLVTSGTSGLRLWELDRQRQLPLDARSPANSWSNSFRLSDQSPVVRSIAVRSWRDARRSTYIELAAGYEDGTVAVWRLVDFLMMGAKPTLWKPHQSPVVSLAFGKGARLGEIASIDASGLVVRWNVPAGRLVAHAMGSEAAFSAQFVGSPYAGNDADLPNGGIATGNLLAYDSTGHELARGGLDGLRTYDLRGNGESAVQLVSGRPTLAVAFVTRGEGADKVANDRNQTPTIAVAGVDVAGQTFVNWLSDELLANQVQKHVTRALTPPECASYISSLRQPSFWSGVLEFVANDRDACSREIPEFGHFLRAQEQARADVDEALRQGPLLDEVGKYSRFAAKPADSARWARSLAAEALRRKATALDRFDPQTAFSLWLKAHELDADRATVFDMLKAAERIALSGNIPLAIEFYKKTNDVYQSPRGHSGALFDPEEFSSEDESESRRQVRTPLSNLCWYGAERAQPESVLEFCDLAVALEEMSELARDNRAMARARAGMVSEAIADMEAYLAANPASTSFEERRKWMNDLKVAAAQRASARYVDDLTVTLMKTLSGREITRQQ